MIQHKIIILTSILTAITVSLTVAADISVIPRPLKCEIQQGTLSASIAKKLESDGFTGSAIVLNIASDSGSKAELGDEGYRLQVQPDKVIIQATTEAGLFYGKQTLHQMLPDVPCCTITDKPRYSWRGFMLDEARTFYGKQAVKDILDHMANLKLNRFHWHLTDNEAWRIEIKKYPKLATVGGIHRNRPDSKPEFYTQEDIREIVKHAEERHITIIPEIEMPGHAHAFGRSYKEFGDRRKGKTINPVSDDTYECLKNILTEIADLFPGPWIHFGGDEVNVNFWDQLPEAKKLMEEKGYASLRDVEHYFNRRMSEVINSLGKKTCGWNEMMHAGIPTEDAVIFLWKWWPDKGPGLLNDVVVTQKYDTVVCPRTPLYLDYVQSKKHKHGRLKRGIVNTHEDIIKFPQFPEYSVEENSRILGIQANLWTDRVQDVKDLEFMIFPRLVAVAESAWTTDENKDLNDFNRRLKIFQQKLDTKDVYYYDPFNPDKHPEIED